MEKVMFDSILWRISVGMSVFGGIRVNEEHWQRCSPPKHLHNFSSLCDSCCCKKKGGWVGGGVCVLSNASTMKCSKELLSFLLFILAKFLLPAAWYLIRTHAVLNLVGVADTFPVLCRSLPHNRLTKSQRSAPSVAGPWGSHLVLCSLDICSLTIMLLSPCVSQSNPNMNHKDVNCF